MRALVISDIHSNLQAITWVLETAPKYDVVWNLGDIVGYGANPNEVANLARKLGGIVVRGNHDRACSGVMRARELHEFSFNFESSAVWTRRVLSKDNKKWLADLSRGPVMPLGHKVQCVHGMPKNESESIFFEEDAWAVLRSSSVRITFYGNTHCQGGWLLSGQELTPLNPVFQSNTSAEHFELPILKRHRYLINPGSVGQSRDGGRRAAFAIYDDAQSLLIWYRVPYE